MPQTFHRPDQIVVAPDDSSNPGQEFRFDVVLRYGQGKQLLLQRSCRVGHVDTSKISAHPMLLATARARRRSPLLRLGNTQQANLCCFVVALRHRMARAWPSDSTSLLPLLIGNARLHRFPPHPSRSRPPPAGAHHSLANRRGRVKAECQPSSWSKCHAPRASRCLELTRAKGAGSGLSANVSYRNPSLIADT
jgi:hypothetical protein